MLAQFVGGSHSTALHMNQLMSYGRALKYVIAVVVNMVMMIMRQATESGCQTGVNGLMKKQSQKPGCPKINYNFS